LKFNALKRRVLLICALPFLVSIASRAQDQSSAATAAPASAPEPAPASGAIVARPAIDPAPPHKPFFKRWVSLQALESTIPAAVLQQVHDWPEEWGKKRSGFEKRLGSLYGQFAVGVLIEDGVKAIHAEDTRYRRLGQGNFFKRTAHVITDTVTARRADGSRTMAWSVPANAYGSWAIATLWSPREYRRAESIFGWGSAGMGAFAGTNMLREFWPDFKSVFRKKK
jgi:hypothetical protein